MKHRELIKGRKCYKCNSTKTYWDKRGWYIWFHNEGKYECGRCHQRRIYQKNHPRIIKPKRYCYSCGADKTGDWFLNKPTELVLCENCYVRLISSPKYKHPKFETEFISCKCGCGELISRYDRKGQEREYKKKHGFRAYIQPKGELSHNWKGGRSIIHKYGKAAWVVRTVGDKQILEHRLVMEQHLGRKLKSTEWIDHINGDPTDNRIENLRLMNYNDFLSMKAQKPEIKERICIICNRGSDQVQQKKWTRKVDHQQKQVGNWFKSDLGEYICQSCYSLKNRINK